MDMPVASRARFVVRGSKPYTSTQGSLYTPGVSTETTGATSLFLGMGTLPPGQRTPTAAHVSQRFSENLAAFYGGRIREVLDHPRFRLHIVTARGRHVLRREHRIGTPLGYLGAFLANAMHRRAMGAWS